MKRLGFFCLVCLSLWGASCGGEEAPAARVYEIDLAGTVVGGLDETPVGGITVRAVNPTIWLQGKSDGVDIDGNTVAKVTTSPDGSFLFPKLNLKKFFMFVILIMGDDDFGNTTYFNTAVGVIDVEQMKKAIVAGDTAIIERDSYAIVPALTVAFTDSLENGPFAGVDLNSHGFVFGSVVDAANSNPVSGAVLKKVQLSYGKAINPTTLLHAAYRNGMDTFEGTQTDATFGSMFAIADDLPMDGVNTQYVAAMIGQQLSTTGAGEAVTVPGIAFATRVPW